MSGPAEPARRPDEPEGVAQHSAAPSARPPWVHRGEPAVPAPKAERRRRLRHFDVPTVEEIRTPAPPDAGDW